MQLHWKSSMQMSTDDRTYFSAESPLRIHQHQDFSLIRVDFTSNLISLHSALEPPHQVILIRMEFLMYCKRARTITVPLQTTLYESAAGAYTTKNYPIALSDARLFAADLNSDGVIDVNYLGKKTSGDTLNIVQYGNQDYDTLVSRKLVDQQFGDLEYDGDLDLFQVIEDDQIALVFYENGPAQKNLAPGIPKKGLPYRFMIVSLSIGRKPQMITLPSRH